MRLKEINDFALKLAQSNTMYIEKSTDNGSDNKLVVFNALGGLLNERLEFNLRSVATL